jgi:hypothetical protein
MTLNPYAPPTAVVADIAVVDVQTEPPFFAVSLAKLILLSICTFGVYEIYWFYRQWKQIAERDREAISPLARGIFTIFFCYPCFARIRDYRAETGTGSPLAAAPLAIGWIGTTLLWRLPDPYGWLSMLALVFLIPVQLEVNKLNAMAAPGHDRNARFSAWNWVAVVVGGLLFLLAVGGTFLPDVE